MVRQLCSPSEERTLDVSLRLSNATRIGILFIQVSCRCTATYKDSLIRMNYLMTLKCQMPPEFSLPCCLMASNNKEGSTSRHFGWFQLASTIRISPSIIRSKTTTCPELGLYSPRSTPWLKHSKASVPFTLYFLQLIQQVLCAL
jgi:hypothetical protein